MTHNPYDLIRAERDRQDRKWGTQDHPDLCPVLTNQPGGSTPKQYADDLGIPTAASAKFICDTAFACGVGSWSAILNEEFAEAIEAAALGDVGALRKELVQSAAVIVAWLEALDRRDVTP